MYDVSGQWLKNSSRRCFLSKSICYYAGVMQMYTPILLIISKNLDNAWRVFEIVKSLQPPELCIAVKSDSNDSRIKNLKMEIDRISDEIDWPCEVKTFFAKTSIDSPLAWFFSTADEGIIIEDTCIPDASFFWFAQAMLERYRAKSSVLTVSGTNVAGIWKSKHSYFFSQYGVAGGWATWKRAWQSDQKELTALFTEGVRDWTKTEFESLTVVPANNLIEHINRRIPRTPLKFPLEHQIVFKVESSYDKYFGKKL